MTLQRTAPDADARGRAPHPGCVRGAAVALLPRVLHAITTGRCVTVCSTGIWHRIAIDLAIVVEIVAQIIAIVALFACVLDAITAERSMAVLAAGIGFG